MAASYQVFSLVFCVWTVLSCYEVSGVSASQRKGQKIVAFFQGSCDTALPNPCQQVCTDIKSGGLYCQCRTGFSINKDGMTCTEELGHSKSDPQHSIDDEVSQTPSDNDVVLPHGNDHIAGKRPSGMGPANHVQYNSDGEVVISDNDVVHVHTEDLTKGLPPLESSAHTRKLKKTESAVYLERGFYNIPEGGSDDVYADVNFNTLDIPEGGDSSSEHLHTNEVEPTTSQKERQHESDKQRLCDNLSCENNGTCAVIESKPVCLCPLGSGGAGCERVSDIGVRYPSFHGTGFLALPMPQNSYQEFQIRLEFKPESQHGLLLFSGEMLDATRDFFSVALENGFLVLRFDCGSGVGEIRTPNRVTLASWNHVVIGRQHNQGSVQLNDGPEVQGKSLGNFDSITFRLNLYLGGYSDMSLIASRVGTTHNFVGCVQELIVNGHSYDLRKKELFGESEFGINVGDCSEGVCQDVTCYSGGTCVASSADQHVCLCPLGYHGDRCEKGKFWESFSHLYLTPADDVHIPHFSGHSFLEFPSLNKSVLSYTEIEIVFKPTSADGMLLYSGYHQNKTGDFISLALQNGHLVFRFDLGTGPATIRTLEPLVTNVWHVVRASRTGLMGTLETDDQLLQSGEARGAYTQLSLKDSLYLGGYPNYDHISNHVNMTKSFTGCIQKVVINDRKFKLIDDAKGGISVDPCAHPCTGNPCLNFGKCSPEMDTYKCYCKIGYDGSNCERAQTEHPDSPKFFGDSYTKYTVPQITHRVTGDRMDLQMYIKPLSPDGLIFWSGEDWTGQSPGDFVALGFHQRSLLLRYNLGSGEAFIGYNDSRLFDGNWHFIRVQRDKQDAYMEIDDREIVEGSSPGEYTSLNTNKQVYLGGMPSIAEKTGGRYTSGYTGCIKNITLATDYQLNILPQATEGRNIGQCGKNSFS